MELTTNNLIKMVIAVLVIVLIILGLYLGMKSYVIPYFSGIGFDESELDVNSQQFQDLIQERNRIAAIKDYDGKEFLYETNPSQRVEVYFDGQTIRIYNVWGGDDYGGWRDREVGFVANNQEIFINSEEGPGWINGAFRYGRGIYRIE
jgi:hypothetical protein